MFQLLDFNENPNVGVYCRVNENIAFIQKGLSKKTLNLISSALDVKIIELTILESTIIGSLLAINSKGAVINNFVDKQTIKIIEKQGLEVITIKDIINAAGNDILVNDYGALIHPDISNKSLEKISKVFDVPVKKGTIGEQSIVGMAAVVTNKGCLCHPKSTDEEREILKDVFNVNVMIGTINHGFPMIGSGLVANTKGAIIGNQTTGIEMGRIEEALGFLD